MDADVVIVGGGPAGIATALFAVAEVPWLRDRLIVLEKERYPREKICAGAIGARADRLLETIGVRVDVPSVPIRGLSVVSRRGSLHAREEAPIGRVVRRIEFDRALADEARGRGIRILEGAAVSAVSVGSADVRVESTAGLLRARSVVGADGVGSFVRRALGIPRGRLLAQVVEVDTIAAAGDRERDVLHFDVADRALTGYAWDFPTVVDGRPLVCRGVYRLAWPGTAQRRAGSDRRAPAPDVGELLDERLALRGVAPEGRVKRFAERGLSVSEPFARPRALLVGEAAGIDPVLGEGIAQAIQYGAVAGRYVARAVQADDLSFATWQGELLRSRVGLDLRIRSRAVPWFYGRARPLMERWVVGSQDLARSGMSYFGGVRVDRRRLAGAAVDLLRAAVGLG